ncbi:hypothetical protein HDU76_011738, partial [Blyttiomyces sp. JEL0837]
MSEQDQLHQHSNPFKDDDKQPSPTTPPTCRVCGNDARFMCSLCGPLVHYCSDVCQTQDWPTHRNECSGVAARRQQQLLEQQQRAGDADARNAAAALGTGGAGGAARVSGDVNHGTEGRNSRNSRSGRRRRPFGRAMAQMINERGFKFGFGRRNNEQTEAIEMTNRTTELDADAIDDMKFYLGQIYLIIKPVIMCIILSVLWVKLTNPVAAYFDYGLAAQPPPSIFQGGVGSVVQGGIANAGSDDRQSLFNALIILSQIVVVTIIILLLFKYNQMKILYGIFGLIVLGLLGLFGFTLGLQLLSVYNAPFDYITFFFWLWNLAAVGLVVIFWKGPLWLQQIYLVVMSSMMAFSLTNLPPVTSWILLALLAVWDLVAVLCPFGPLRLLIESSRENNREIPALLYSAAVWMMATPAEPRPTSTETLSPTDTTTPLVPASSTSNTANPTAIDTSVLSLNRYNTTGDTTNPDKPQQQRGRQHNDGTTTPRNELAVIGARDGSITPVLQSSASTSDLLNGRRRGGGGNDASDAGAGDTTLQDGEEDIDIEEEERSGMKLGLGDFVFYSVLVARAVPFVNLLINVPGRLIIHPGDASGLWVGQSGGGGLTYV